MSGNYVEGDTAMRCKPQAKRVPRRVLRLTDLDNAK
jgi:hypothetical protein